MNTRIRELIERATVLTDNPDERVQRLELNPELLVELVVKECAQNAFAYTRKNNSYYERNGWECLPNDLKSAVKKYFGVE